MNDDQARPAIELRVTSGPHRGARFSFDEHSVFVVGRSRKANLTLADDPHFSRFHFRIEIRPPQCHLVDLQSRNGTLVNGTNVDAVHLNDGDKIQCGSTTISVVIPFQTDASPTLGGTSTAFVPTPPSEATMDIAPGDTSPEKETIGGYQIEGKIGQGAMGVVFAAVEQATRRRAAIKLLDEEKPTNKQVEMFIREASILSQLRHARIVRFQEFGMHQGRLYLAMDLIDTVDYRELIRRQSRPKQIRLACGIAQHILEALEFAHANNIVHRDIKPENILCEKREGRLFALLGDLGLAKNFLNAGLTQISQDGITRGTPRYMSPEQITNCRYAKPSCDIYSLGACLYELLCDGPLFATNDAGTLINMILNGEIAPLQSRAADLSAELCFVVERAVATEPSDRFASAAHFREALSEFV